MSAQFMVVMCEIPSTLTLAHLEAARERIRRLPELKLNDIADMQGWDEEMLLEDVRSRLLEAVNVLDGFCEDSDNEPPTSLTDITLGVAHLRYVVTGGVSRGDDPADFYTEVCILAEADVLLTRQERILAWRQAAVAVEARNTFDEVNGLTRYTVAGYYRPTGERYASAFWAVDSEHAEQQAINEAGPEMEVVAVILGDAFVVA